LDEALMHLRRYSQAQLEEVMREAGFEVERTIITFNKIGVLSWILNGKILKRKHFSKIQMKILNMFTWVFRLINPILPWKGLSVIVIGVKNG
jgi:hypothetical protein